MEEELHHVPLPCPVSIFPLVPAQVIVKYRKERGEERTARFTRRIDPPSAYSFCKMKAFSASIYGGEEVKVVYIIFIMLLFLISYCYFIIIIILYYRIVILRSTYSYLYPCMYSSIYRIVM